MLHFQYIVPMDERVALYMQDEIQSYPELFTYITQHIIQPNNPIAIYSVQPKVLIEYFEAKYKIQSGVDSSHAICIHNWYKYDTDKYNALIDQIVTKIYKSNESTLDVICQQFQQQANDEKDAIEQKIQQIIPKHEKKKSAYRHCFCKNAVLGLMTTTGLALITVFSWTISHCNNI